MFLITIEESLSIDTKFHHKTINFTIKHRLQMDHKNQAYILINLKNFATKFLQKEKAQQHFPLEPHSLHAFNTDHFLLIKYQECPK